MSEWIEWKWTPEKPYPETLETRVDVMFDDGWRSDEHDCTDTVGFWEYGINNFESGLGWGNSIAHYRIAED